MALSSALRNSSRLLQQQPSTVAARTTPVPVLLSSTRNFRTAKPSVPASGNSPLRNSSVREASTNSSSVTPPHAPPSNASIPPTSQIPLRHVPNFVSSEVQSAQKPIAPASATQIWPPKDSTDGPTVTSASDSTSRSSSIEGGSPPPPADPHASTRGSGQRPVIPPSTPFRPYKDLPTPDLINSYLVFQLCRIPQLPALAGPVIYAAEKAKVLEAPVYSVVKSTFFKHFCGGEDIREVSPTMARFAAKGVGSILDLAMEADLDDTSLSGESAAQEAARVRALMEESIDTASSQPDSFIAVKVTAFVPPATLVRWTNTLRAFEASFNSALDNTDSHGLSRAEFVRAFLEFAKVRDPVAVAKIAGRIEALFPSADSNGDGRVDWIEASELFSLSSPEVREVLLQAIKSNPQDAQTDPATALATAEDLITIDLVMAELDLLCGYAKKRGVKIMIDAEQSYFQAAIDDVALTLLQRFNPSLADGQSGAPTVYNTYQMYLRDSYQRLVADVERAKRLNHAFGAKIVRGAYMVAERARAAELSYPDPIHPNLEATHHAYNSAIDFLLSHVKENTEHGSVSPVSFVIASHNGKSVQHAVKQLEQMPESARKHVAFAQLMGMQDGTTFRLAENGWKAYKYVPYGPIHVTIPYLLRRATENSGMLSGASSDRDSLWEEIWGRLKGRA